MIVIVSKIIMEFTLKPLKGVPINTIFIIYQNLCDMIRAVLRRGGKENCVPGPNLRGRHKVYWNGLIIPIHFITLLKISIKYSCNKMIN